MSELTRAGKLYREKMRRLGESIWEGVEERLWSEQPLEPFDPGYVEDHPEYDRLAGERVFSRYAHDPRRRVCKKHGEPYRSAGNYSVCGTCMDEAPASTAFRFDPDEE